MSFRLLSGEHPKDAAATFGFPKASSAVRVWLEAFRTGGSIRE